MDTEGIKNFAPTGWARGLAGLGAGIQGRGLEFAQQQKELGDERRDALVKDARKTLVHIRNGEFDNATGLLKNRIDAINRLGGDPKDTNGILELLAAGDYETAERELASVDAAGVAAGVLEPMNKHIGVAGSYAVELGPDGNYTTQSLPGVAQEEAAKNAAEAARTSAKTEFLADGSALMSDNQGNIRYFGADGVEVTDPAARRTAIERASQMAIDSKVTAARGTAEASQAVTMAGDFFDRLEPLRSAIGQSDEALRLLDAGAQTGPVMALLPSITSASQNLDNLQARMGLNLIQSTTFGALSESELKFALSTALPDKLTPPELRKWVTEKKRTQTVLMNQLNAGAQHLASGGTLGTWMQQMNAMSAQQSEAAPAAAAPAAAAPAAGLPPGAADDDVVLDSGKRVPRAEWNKIIDSIRIIDPDTGERTRPGAAK